jgi:hypothetical protein
MLPMSFEHHQAEAQGREEKIELVVFQGGTEDLVGTAEQRADNSQKIRDSEKSHSGLEGINLDQQQAD